MGRLSIDVRSRIVNMWRANFKVKDIINIYRLAEEGVKVSQTAVYNLLTKFKTESIADMKKRARSRRLSEEHYRFFDELMAKNTDLTSLQLYSAFFELSSVWIQRLLQLGRPL